MLQPLDMARELPYSKRKGGLPMEHRHVFDTVGHPLVSPRAAELGIKTVEMRKCSRCGELVPFIETKDGWFALVATDEQGEQDILMA